MSKPTKKPTIVSTEDTLEGMPRIAGTRIPVVAVLRAIVLNVSLDCVLTAYPRLKIEQVKEALWWTIEHPAIVGGQAKVAESQRKEVCICAAVKLPSGEVIRGHRHSHCYDVVRARPAADREATVKAVQGFVTSHNRFVDRKEGMAMQSVSGLPSCYGKDGAYFGEELFSEDLYSEPIDAARNER